MDDLIKIKIDIKNALNIQGDSNNKEVIVHYLKNCWCIGRSPSIEKDELTGESLSMGLEMMTDGKYVWTNTLSYYVEKYDIVLPKDFVEHIFMTKEVMRKLKRYAQKSGCLYIKHIKHWRGFEVYKPIAVAHEQLRREIAEYLLVRGASARVATRMESRLFLKESENRYFRV
ncbi:MAG: hypothetical protein GX127_07065 [Eubacteriaceae bacterium]|jgi:hypothetical protein|nr:hypothetical protein [Eubacteriaceae bacterium]